MYRVASSLVAKCDRAIFILLGWFSVDLLSLIPTSIRLYIGQILQQPGQPIPVLMVNLVQQAGQFSPVHAVKERHSEFTVTTAANSQADLLIFGRTTTRLN